MKPSQPDHLILSADGREGFDAEGQGFYGHLEAKPDGTVVFIKDDERPTGG